jgi:spectrin alpha
VVFRQLFTIPHVICCVFSPQVTFESGLQAFEQEGVQKVTTLKDDLVKAQHAQSPAIMGRSDELVQR